MIKDDLRRELVAMRGEDMRVRDELMASGELGGPCVPRMEEVHKRNASRLGELIVEARCDTKLGSKTGSGLFGMRWWTTAR